VQGTQLLAIDTGAAMGLLRRALIGDELTQKEKQALQRTLTDLASVVPIGILMLLPVSSPFTLVFCLFNKEKCHAGPRCFQFEWCNPVTNLPHPY
jgi:hypothetical protein